MIQYIDKSALVAEIEKRIEETKGMKPKFDQFWYGQISAFKGVLKILDTLEVKEVDYDNDPKWKPSDLQLDTLEQIIDGEPYNRNVLVELFNSLKRIK